MSNTSDNETGSVSDQVQAHYAQHPATDQVCQVLREAADQLPEADSSVQPSMNDQDPSPEQPDDALAQLQKAASERDVFYDRMLRARADLDNLQKRARRELSEALRYASQSLLGDLLAVVDHLDMSLAAARESNDIGAVIKGIELIQAECARLLEAHGVKPIEAKDKAFDPHRHEALATVETTDYTPGAVADVLRPGYMLHDRVLRAAQVRVAAPPTESAEIGPS